MIDTQVLDEAVRRFPVLLSNMGQVRRVVGSGWEDWLRAMLSKQAVRDIRSEYHRIVAEKARLG